MLLLITGTVVSLSRTNVTRSFAHLASLWVLPSRCASECLIERWAYRFQGGCVVIPIIKADTVAGIYGRRLDRSHADVWATGFSATMFEGTYSAREGSGALVATSLLDGLCILGTLELANNMNQSITVFAPGCARGFTKNDLKGMANRYEHVTVLGSYGSDVVTQLQRLGRGRRVRGGSNSNLELQPRRCTCFVARESDVAREGQGNHS